MKQKLNNENLQNVAGGGFGQQRGEWAGPAFKKGDIVYKRGQGNNTFEVTYVEIISSNALYMIEGRSNDKLNFGDVREEDLGFTPFPT